MEKVLLYLQWYFYDIRISYIDGSTGTDLNIKILETKKWVLDTVVRNHTNLGYVRSLKAFSK